MNASTHISSLQNPGIKQLLVLKEKGRERKKTGRFVVEGLRELQLALKGNYTLEKVYYNETIISRDSVLNALPDMLQNTSLISISTAVYQKLAYRTSTEGVLAIAHSKTHKLSAIRLTANPLILVAEAPEKPGNIGALLRTADAAKVDAVLIANAKGDLYNPNIIRSSVGCVFTTAIGIGTTKEVIAFLKQHHIAMYCAALSASETYTAINFKKPAAIVVGTEATGLSSEWLTSSTENIIIPMQGEIDSMNVSVSAAILIFEAKRQRGFQ